MPRQGRLTPNLEHKKKETQRLLQMSSVARLQGSSFHMTHVRTGVALKMLQAVSEESSASSWSAWLSQQRLDKLLRHDGRRLRLDSLRVRPLQVEQTTFSLRGQQNNQARLFACFVDSASCSWRSCLVVYLNQAVKEQARLPAVGCVQVEILL